jgi:hypothetical protein
MDRRTFLIGATALSLQSGWACAGKADRVLAYGGVATHLSFFNTPYADSASVARAVKALGARWARDGIPTGQGDSWYDRVYLAARRVHASTETAPATYFSMIGGHPAEPVDETLDVLEPLVRYGIVRVIEGANEWDRNSDEHEGVIQYGPGVLKELREHQEELYAKVHQRFPGVQVAGPTLDPDNAELMGDLSHAMDLGNLHLYFTRLPIDVDGMDRHLRQTRRMTGSRPLIATESNFIIGDGYRYGANREGERAQASGYVEILRRLGERGVTRVFCYELVDGSSPRDPTSGRENNFGCFRSDWSAKPLAFEVREVCQRG